MELQQNKTVQPYLSDGEIVELYWARDEQAITQTDRKYKPYLLTVARNIVRDVQDCEECLNDTYLGAWNSMPPSKPNVLRAFLTTIMRRVAVNRYHHNTRKRTVPSEMTVALSELETVLSDGGDVFSESSVEHLSEVISTYVRLLTERRRYIFMSRYYVAEPIETIARELGVSRSTVQKELAAIRKGLKEALEREGYSL